MYYLISIPLLIWLFVSAANNDTVSLIYHWRDLPIPSLPKFFLGNAIYVALVLFSGKLFMQFWDRKIGRQYRGHFLSHSLFYTTASLVVVGFSAFFSFLSPKDAIWGGYWGHQMYDFVRNSFGENPALLLLLILLSLAVLLHFRISWVSHFVIESNDDPIKSFLAKERESIPRRTPGKTSYPQNSIQHKIQEKRLLGNIPWFTIAEKEDRPRFYEVKEQVLALSGKKRGSKVAVIFAGEVTERNASLKDGEGFWNRQSRGFLDPIRIRDENEVFIFKTKSDQEKRDRDNYPPLEVAAVANLAPLKNHEEISSVNINEEMLVDKGLVSSQHDSPVGNDHVEPFDGCEDCFEDGEIDQMIDEEEILEQTEINEDQVLGHSPMAQGISPRDEQNQIPEEIQDEVIAEARTTVKIERSLAKTEKSRSEVQLTFDQDFEKDLLYYDSREFPQYVIPRDIFEESVPENEFIYKTEINIGAAKLEETLAQFSIEAKVIGHKRGPVVTMYEVAIAPGIKVNRITNLADDIAMAFASESVRIIAPIPGKSAIGIEVPNKHRSIVRLGDLWNKEDVLKKGSLVFPLGKKLNGEVEFLDLTKMPHLLIAGATGSGKSVCVNSIISSLIYRYDPSHVRFLLIDPKLVELQLYNGIPHLLHKVITDAKSATAALYWVIQEMEYRYTMLSKLNVRDLNSYNSKVESYISQGYKDYKRFPFLVILIDEFADLMMVSGKELEDFVTRIAQKSRAVGIHLILATQRPSVNIITGIIKANFPARIAFQVASMVDSRTIIDQKGAEKLLGKGDSLFQSPYMSFPFRSQTAYVTEEEVLDLVKVVQPMAKPRFIQLELLDEETGSSVNFDEDDDLFEEAVDIILESRKASASYLQRRLRIGYNRAARMIEAMEELGYIGAAQGSKPRDILVDKIEKKNISA